MDTETEQLVSAFLDGELDEPQADRLGRRLETHAADRRQFLDLAWQARVLETIFAPQPDLSAAVLRRVRARQTRRKAARWAVAAAAAIVLLAVGAAAWFSRGRPGPTPTPTPPAALAGWRVAPTGAAAYRVVAPGRIRLDRGELLIESVAPMKPGAARAALTVETPAGTVSARGTRFYVGSHTPTKGATMNASQMTRVLVLSGVVTLATSAGLVAGEANELLVAEADKAPSKLAVQANSDFAFDLYAQLAKENAGENLFFSPYSMLTALTMTAEGARGQTAAEMGKVLRFPAEARRIGDDAQLIPWQTSLIHAGMSELNERLTAEKDPKKVAALRAKLARLQKAFKAANAKLKGPVRGRAAWQARQKARQEAERLAAQIQEVGAQLDQYELRIANALWVQQGWPIRKEFLEIVQPHYQSPVYAADFKADPEAQVARINAWADRQTKHRIKEVFKQLDPLTRVVLANAIYFKGDWAVPFDASLTKPRPFALPGGQTVQTPMMYARNLEVGRYAAFNADGSFFETPEKIKPGQREGLYPAEDGFAMLELPYKGGDLSMVVLAPNAPAGLAALEKRLTPAAFATWVGRLQKRDTRVYLPRFRLETGYDMTPTLKAMGMRQAFAADAADFSGLCTVEELFIGQVVHKAFVEVNEVGTEAAAVTAVAMAGKGIPEMVPFRPTFRADRPFLFAIRDMRTGTVLFIGRFMAPPAAGQPAAGPPGRGG